MGEGLTRAQCAEFDWLKRQPRGGAFVDDPRMVYPRRHYEALERAGLVTIDRSPFGRWWVQVRSSPHPEAPEN